MTRYTGFQKDSEHTREAARKGGLACPAASRPFARDPEFARRAALIGAAKRRAARNPLPDSGAADRPATGS